MDPNLDSALTDVVRRWARPTTLDELRERGVQKVRSVSMNRVAALLEKAVNRTLVQRTLGDGGEDSDSFSRAAREEFVRMLRDGEAATPGPEADQAPVAESALEQLKRELRERRAVLARQQRELSSEPGVEGPGDQELEEKLQRLFRAWGGDPERPSPLEREVVRLSVAELRRERQRGRQALLDGSRRQVDQLERRVAKLSRLLEETEAELQRALRRPVGEAGVASIYRDVQGLDAAATQRERKAELMGAIFRANLELRASLVG